MNREEQAKKIQEIIAKAWADEAFKQKLISHPMETLKEEGLDVPPEVEIRMVECTDKVTYFVLPPKPTDGEVAVEMVEGRLAANSWGGGQCMICY